MDRVLGLEPGVPRSIPSSGRNLFAFCNTLIRFAFRCQIKESPHTFSMGHAGANRKSLNDIPWEMLSLRLSRRISAPLRMALLSQR